MNRNLAISVRLLLDYIDAVDATNGNTLLTMGLLEFVPARWWHQVLHNQSAWLIRAALFFGRALSSQRTVPSAGLSAVHGSCVPIVWLGHISREVQENLLCRMPP
jgi:hypothetical protein